MSTRTNLRPQSVITNGDMSASITSAPTILQSITEISYEVVWSGTSPIGTISVQVSNDYSVHPDGSVNNAGHWVTATLSVAGTPASSVPLSGNTGEGMIDPFSTAAYAVRLVYTRASGTGTMNAVINGKVS